VLHRHVFVLEPGRLSLGRVEDPGETLGDPDLARGLTGAGDPGPGPQVGLHGGDEPNRVAPGLRDETGDETFGLGEQRKEQMLAIHLGVPEAGGQRLGFAQRLP
jgi:hypothetical protein